jgi:SAM-dependent methyltransferase
MTFDNRQGQFARGSHYSHQASARASDGPYVPLMHVRAPAMAVTFTTKSDLSDSAIMSSQPATKPTKKKKPLFERLSTWLFNRRVDKIYAENDYLDAYRKHTDMRAKRDPKTAIGGMWEEVGQMQIDFVTGEGLTPDCRMLDVGCGTLRGGRHFIRHLDPGNYTGVDISEGVIEAGKALIVEEGLVDKRPRLIPNTTGDLRFDMFEDETFDFILAQSVFTHLKEDHLEECFANIGRIMGPETRFYFTFYMSDSFEQTGAKRFRFPFSFFERVAKENGFDLTDRSEDYPHPHGQIMAFVKKQSS